MVSGELDRRAAIQNASESLVERIVSEGYRQLAKRAHPDAGGTAEDMKALGQAREWLKDRIAKA